MGTILSSKGIGAVKDAYLTLTVETVGKTRQSRKLVAEELPELIRKAVTEENKESMWVQKEYKFFFSQRQYFWKGKGVYLTAGEELFLFRWLVLDDEAFYNAQWFYLRNLRKRLGKDFLRDIQEEKNV